MQSVIEALGTAVFAYLVGSIPASYVIARYVVGADVREIGEGNAGARNVFHEVGRFWGFATFLADFGKGALVAAVFVGSPSWQVFLAGAFVFLGHAYPVWLRFVGGKGLATVGGFSVVLVPWAAVGTRISVRSVSPRAAWYAAIMATPANSPWAPAMGARLTPRMPVTSARIVCSSQKHSRMPWLRTAGVSGWRLRNPGRLAARCAPRGLYFIVQEPSG